MDEKKRDELLEKLLREKTSLFRSKVEASQSKEQMQLLMKAEQYLNMGDYENCDVKLDELKSLIK